MNEFPTSIEAKRLETDRSINQIYTATN